MLLKNKVVIITGAGRGIGQVIALKFAQEGANVIVASLLNLEVKETLEKINKFKGDNLGIKVDISDHEDVRRMIKRTIQKFGKIDVLVNNAGVQGEISTIINSSVSKWLNPIKINLFGTFLCAKEVLPYMIKRKKGKIINFSGGGATSSRPNFSAYACSKTAIVRLTEILSDEVKKYNIQVNAISPGAVNTKMLEETLKAGKKAGKKEMIEAKKQLKNGGTSPEKAAELILFLASDKSDKLSGKLISAKWDDWKKWDEEKIKKIIRSSNYTLRRIDNKYFKEIKK